MPALHWACGERRGVLSRDCRQRCVTLVPQYLQPRALDQGAGDCSHAQGDPRERGHHRSAREGYLAVVLDWFSRRVLSWRLSITMDAAFCVETLEDALARHGKRTSSTPTRAASLLGWPSPAGSPI